MGEDARDEPAFPGALLAYDGAACLRFYSRLPVPALPGEGDPHAAPDFTRVPRMLPLAGLVLALPGGLVLLAAWGLGLGPFLAATLAVATGVLITGALHEDGLADVADGFGGGTTRERRLEIMRDSRIGAYGGVALVLALALRIGALATLLDRTGSGAALALVLAAALSRTAALAPMVLLVPARRDGAAASVGRPGRPAVAIAGALALTLALLGGLLGLPVGGVLLMLLLSGLGALAVTALARRRIGGQTGDVIGACQQVAEIAALLGLVAMVPA
ncbi:MULTISPECIES: adenosylcobinamide-GDP ribazoletransferase [unclassified Methylobacterium]|uniref:adenosylcobinamide-GDP ribazoletransferase n=1 Tax=unclassified Methylobacterium TaxID=2615210 RepID=UPI0006FC9316|nr:MULTISPECIES: adenosylcobinamide-GDP ribazoletransferase [unclassified Methylobacterium]KQO69652.1 cobalamin biosynthesis protein CobS [Methylobacterium sp. Leaf87]KQP36664.1 cobalamin biosynthesis protein CobS [Methylobacterium sp. Leaf100]